MKNSLNTRSLLFPLLFTLTVLTAFNLAGCKNGSEKGPCYHEIDVKNVEPHIISIAEAVKMTKDFRASIVAVNKQCPQFKDSLQFGDAEAFNCDAMQTLLNAKDSNGVCAAGIRIYFGRDDKGIVKFVLVPYDKNGNDIITKLIGVEKPGVAAKELGSPGQAIEQGQLCPTVCSGPPLGPQ